ncbi:hypothetical protein H477_5731 [[Clostridium] sordellii ATCC 9714]|nr:hypothetical protein H477_5731 [[Clostridium] sordellii ATCC 9714] [Paeniclostridium sordellii ATCC 9714]
MFSFNKLVESNILKFGIKGLLGILLGSYLVWFLLLFVVNFVMGELKYIKNK